MRKTIAIALCALLASPAIAESVGEKTGINSALGISPTTRDFVQEATISDMLEIASSKLAEQRADDATKAFAKQMIADHTKTSDELRAAVGSDPNTPLPSALALLRRFDRLLAVERGFFSEKALINQRQHLQKRLRRRPTPLQAL